MRPLIFALLIALPLEAQIFEPKRPEKSDLLTLSFSAFGGVPMGEFREYENGGGGIDVAFGVQPFRREPLVIRTQLAGMAYDAATAWGYQDVCDEFGSCWTETVQYTARNHSMIMVHIGPEITAIDGKWRPFGYALAGWTFFNSRVNLKPETPTGPDPESQSLFSSSNVSSVYGAGVRRVGTKIGRETGFEFSARFVRNASARYLTEQGIHRRSDGTYDVSPRTGAANVLAFHVGFWIGPHVNWNERR